MEANNAALLEDAAQNADLYIANQDVDTQTQVYSLCSDVYSVKRCSVMRFYYVSILLIYYY